MRDEDGSDYTTLSADIVSAYVTNNSVRPSELPDLIASIHSALQSLSAPQQAAPEKLEPPISIKKSITPDYLISLEDGKRYKSLKRHLTSRSLTPEQYREKWGLPRDYPMVAPNYAKQRSEMAKALGFGQIRPGQAATEAPPAPEPEVAAEPTAKRRAARKRKEVA